MQYRLHPGLLIYPAPIVGKRVLIAEVSSSRPPLILRHPRISWALSVLPERFTADDALERWRADASFAEHADAFWYVVEREGIAIPADDDDDDPAIMRHDAWARFGWAEASVYHEATRDYPFVKMDESDAFTTDEARMIEYVAAGRPPSIYQTRPHTSSIELRRAVEADGSPAARLASFDASQRRGLEGLGFLFDFCFGVRDVEPFNVQGDFLRKTIPSGGARHPTEVFFAAFAGAPVPPGVYHYNVEHHRLDCVNPGDQFAEFEDATFDLFQKYDDPPFGLIVFTSVVERAMWRYRDARSARAIFVDVGHALMAYRGITNALGIHVYTYQKARDAMLCTLLRIDPKAQPPLFVGTLV